MANPTINLQLQSSNTESDRINIGQRWGMRLEEFEEELHLQSVTDDNDKIICLKNYGGREIKLILKYLPEYGTKWKRDL